MVKCRVFHELLVRVWDVRLTVLLLLKDLGLKISGVEDGTGRLDP